METENTRLLINHQNLLTECRFSAETNGTFVDYVWGQSFPTVYVSRIYLTMDPIGFVFLVFFAIVIIIQVYFTTFVVTCIIKLIMKMF